MGIVCCLVYFHSRRQLPGARDALWRKENKNAPGLAEVWCLRESNEAELWCV